MAIRLVDEYPERSIPADADYPHGSVKNKVSPTDLGTPVEKAWLNDIFGFLQALLVKAGITPSGVPDTVQASDYLDALQALSGGMRTKIINIGVWNMDATESVTIAHGLDYSKIRTVRASVRDDLVAFTYDLLYDYGNEGVLGQGPVWDTTNIILKRATGGFFDNAPADFGASGINRGWIIIQYVD